MDNPAQVQKNEETQKMKRIRFKVPRLIIKPKLSKLPLKVIAFVLVVAAVFVISYLQRGNPFTNQELDKLVSELSLNSPEEGEKETDPYLAFFFEIYGLTKNEYWNVLDEAFLGNLTKLAVEKINETTIELTPTNKQETREVLVNALDGKTVEEKKEFITQVADVVLANLEPFGRSRLYSVKQQQDLSNTVLNIDPDMNQYEELGIGKDATQDEIEKAYSEKKAELESQGQTSEVEGKLVALERAYAALGDEKNREVYDEHKIEPTITGKLLTSRIYYMKISKFSPNTVEELNQVAEKADAGNELSTLIIDLRGNIGGAIDGLPYFLGPFIGQDQYAYQFFRRGEKKDFKTVTGWLPSLVRYKKLVVLIDSAGQSSAEVFAAVLKKYNVGVLVGEKTKGWGTVEKVYNLNNQITDEETYSVFLVHSVTLRDDGQPIEGRGVDPHVDITSDNWEQELYKYFSDQELVNVVRGLVE